MTAPVDRARALAGDPRPTTWLDQPGRGTELLAVLRGLLRAYDETVTKRDEYLALLRANTTVLNHVRAECEDHTRENADLSEAAAKVMDLHRDSADSTCSSCRVRYPCHTLLAIRRVGKGAR